MAGDDLTIALFFIGLAVTFGVAAMSQAGWKHKILIACLFGIGGLFFLTGVFWPWIKWVSPSFSASAGEIANKPISWFVMIMFALGAAMFRGRKIEHVYHGPTPKIDAITETQRQISSLNTLDKVFDRQRIQINDFYRIDFQQWEGKTFTNCEIFGPGPIILNGATNLSVGQFNDCDFVRVKSNHPINFAVAFNNTNFINCYFYRVVIYIPEYLASTFDGMGANWITK